ncbi:MAG TPA: tRNA (adenosine(37)-N6)-dimethylallyltransferase MiaA [Pirellulales bacterium]|nr:tRNA (adenosine(37)-N6)-dimethylallyltransferase MiaA [Pirellulales bacterium]
MKINTPYYYFPPAADRQVINPPVNPVAPLADCRFITGATASGKSELGLELARRLNAEIVSLDSMAVYRGLDIGTAKPSVDARREVPHHLIDLVEPDAEFSLAQYLAAATRASEAIISRGREPLFVGGTPLYLKSLLRGIFQGPAADWELRHRLVAEAHERGADWLHQRVAEVDPAAARRLHPHDTRRLVRALEVFEKTGRPISDWQRQFDRARPAEECRVFVLDWPREELYRRIDARVEAMFAAGLIDEVRHLLAAGKRLGRTARQALGYREVLDHLAGNRSLPDTIELVKTRTRQFARRQLTWFRSLSECRWISMGDGRTAGDLVAEIVGSGPGTP